MRGQQTQTSCQYEIGTERLADLLSTEPTLDKREDRIHGLHQSLGQTHASEARDGSLCDGTAQILRYIESCGKGRDH